MLIARDTGNRFDESPVAAIVFNLEAQYGAPLAAFEYFIVAVRNYQDAGDTAMIRSPLAVLAAVFNRLGR